MEEFRRLVGDDVFIDVVDIGDYVVHLDDLLKRSSSSTFVLYRGKEKSSAIVLLEPSVETSVTHVSSVAFCNVTFRGRDQSSRMAVRNGGVVCLFVRCTWEPSVSLYADNASLVLVECQVQGSLHCDSQQLFLNHCSLGPCVCRTCVAMCHVLLLGRQTHLHARNVTFLGRPEAARFALKKRAKRCFPHSTLSSSLPSQHCIGRRKSVKKNQNQNHQDASLLLEYRVEHCRLQDMPDCQDICMWQKKTCSHNAVQHHMVVQSHHAEHLYQRLSEEVKKNNPTVVAGKKKNQWRGCFNQHEYYCWTQFAQCLPRSFIDVAICFVLSVRHSMPHVHLPAELLIPLLQPVWEWHVARPHLPQLIELDGMLSRPEERRTNQDDDDDDEAHFESETRVSIPLHIQIPQCSHVMVCSSHIRYRAGLQCSYLSVMGENDRKIYNSNSDDENDENSNHSFISCDDLCIGLFVDDSDPLDWRVSHQLCIASCVLRLLCFVIHGPHIRCNPLRMLHELMQVCNTPDDMQQTVMRVASETWKQQNNQIIQKKEHHQQQNSDNDDDDDQQQQHFAM